MEQIKAQRSPKHCCIKFWGKDLKLVDFELIDQFVASVKPDDIYAGFTLLDLEQMWQVLTNLDPDNLTRVITPRGEVIEWLWTDKNGKETKTTYPFSAGGIMTIMNDEFFA